MRSFNPDQLYQLLPNLYRHKDQQQGQPLRALMAIMGTELAEFIDEIDAAYANCFIETCEPALVPYLASLFGIDDLQETADIISNPRAYVANTYYYRARKGQQRVLEQILKDVTGWYGYAKLYSPLLAITPHLQSSATKYNQTINVRNTRVLAAQDTAFGQLAHMPIVRSSINPSKYGMNHVGIFIWRLNNYPVWQGFAKPVDNVTGGFTFHPLGVDTSLFNKPQTADAVKPQSELNLPVTIRPAELQAQPEAYYGAERSFAVYIIKEQNGVEKSMLVDVAKLSVQDLAAWPQVAADKLAVDPIRGRLRLGAELAAQCKRVEVSYQYGFSSALGGGHYDKTSSLISSGTDETQVVWHKAMLAEVEEHGLANTLAELVLTNNASRLTINLKDDSTLVDDPLEDDSGSTLNLSNSNTQELVIQASNDARPCWRLLQGLTIVNSDAERLLTVRLTGLLLEGKLTLQGNIELYVNHCTLLPSAEPSLDGTELSTQSSVSIANSIVGSLHLNEAVAQLQIQDSIVDGQLSQAAIVGNTGDSFGPSTTLERVTVLGKVQVLKLPQVADSIITGLVKVARAQTGGIRYSYLPVTAETYTPQRYRCQPEQSDVRPIFTSTRYGQPGYCQLSAKTSSAIRSGAENGAEMGCFQTLSQPEREKGVQQVLDEYLPFNLQPQIFYVT